MKKIFLSYSRKDEDFVENLYQRLVQDGVKCFFDKKHIAWGENVVLALEKGIKECEIIVPILSPDYLNSEWAKIERTSAMMKDPAGLKRKIRPLLLKSCDVSSTFFNAINYIDISTKEKFEANYHKICSDLGGDVGEENLAEKISRKYKLKKVLLVSTPQSAKINESLGFKAAQYFIDNVPEHSVVGVSCGNTIFNMAKSLKEFIRTLEIFPISFNVGPSLVGVLSPYATLFEIRKKNPSAITYDIPIPAFFSNNLDLERRAFLGRKDIANLRERAYNPNAAFYSAGHLGPGSSFERASSHLREIVDPNFDYRILKEKGACGEINWYPYSITGDPIEHPITAHCTSICLEKIKKLANGHNTHIVLVAGGASKIEAILGALRGQYLNVLITDIDSAKAVMELENAHD